MKYACCPETQHKKAETVWSPLECQSGLNSDIVMEKSWHPETAPSPIILHSSVKEKKKQSMCEQIPPLPEFYLTQPNWKPYKASVLTIAISSPLNWCQCSSLLYETIICLFFLLFGSMLLPVLGQQKHGQPARMSDSISRLLVSICHSLYYILPPVCTQDLIYISISLRLKLCNDC